MDDHERLADLFEVHRPHLRAVAYRMLGSLTEADDAVQDAWFRFTRSDTAAVENLAGWLTTMVARSSLDLLRRRASRREDPLEPGRLPDPIVTSPDTSDPERQALVADGIGIALLVVLDTLPPAQRLAFVLHDMFGVPFDQIAPIVGRSAAAARQLASRARRQVREAPIPDTDPERQRRIVDAFLAAARDADFDGLLAVLDPDVVLRSDEGPGGSREIRGAGAVSQQASAFSRMAALARPALVNGAPGLVVAGARGPLAVLAFTVHRSRIVAIDVVAEPRRLDHLDLDGLDLDGLDLDGLGTAGDDPGGVDG